jgi:hypothetical protein
MIPLRHEDAIDVEYLVVRRQRRFAEERRHTNKILQKMSRVEGPEYRFFRT